MARIPPKSDDDKEIIPDPEFESIMLLGDVHTDERPDEGIDWSTLEVGYWPPGDDARNWLRYDSAVLKIHQVSNIGMHQVSNIGMHHAQRFLESAILDGSIHARCRGGRDRFLAVATKCDVDENDLHACLNIVSGRTGKQHPIAKAKVQQAKRKSRQDIKNRNDQILSEANRIKKRNPEFSDSRIAVLIFNDPKIESPSAEQVRRILRESRELWNFESD